MQSKHVSRAKLFLSFDSLKGFKDFLKKKEKIIVPKKYLLEDCLELLDYKIHQIQKGDMIKVIYYEKGEYIQKEGLVAAIDLDVKKYIQIVHTIIPLQDIMVIE